MSNDGESLLDKSESNISSPVASPAAPAQEVASKENASKNPPVNPTANNDLESFLTGSDAALVEVTNVGHTPVLTNAFEPKDTVADQELLKASPPDDAIDQVAIRGTPSIASGNGAVGTPKQRFIPRGPAQPNLSSGTQPVKPLWPPDKPGVQK